MKIKNYHIYGDDKFLKRLEEEYLFMGRSVRREEDRLIVMALPGKRKKIAQVAQRRR